MIKKIPSYLKGLANLANFVKKTFIISFWIFMHRNSLYVQKIRQIWDGQVGDFLKIGWFHMKWPTNNQ